MSRISYKLEKHNITSKMTYVICCSEPPGKFLKKGEEFMQDNISHQHVVKTSEQWNDRAVEFWVVPRGCLCIELTPKKKTLLKVGEGNKYYSQLPYITSDVDLSNYYTKEEIDNIINNINRMAIMSTEEYDTKNDLPPTGNKLGDVRFVKSQSPSIKIDPDIYLWNGNKWIFVGYEIQDIDLRDYLKKDEFHDLFDPVKSKVEVMWPMRHQHNNLDTLNRIEEPYTTAEKEKLATLKNYDDEIDDIHNDINGLKADQHHHDNKEFLDTITEEYQIWSVEDREKFDNIPDYHEVIEEMQSDINDLEEKSHTHGADGKGTLDILNQIEEPYTTEEKEKLATLKNYAPFNGTDGMLPGRAGLVPAPATSDLGKFLASDGTWQIAGGSDINNFIGATDTPDGERGLVPAPLMGQETYFLCGNGMWQPLPYEAGVGLTLGTPYTHNENTDIPETYLQIEYLESTGTQHIDFPNLAVDNYVEITIDFSITHIVDDTWISGNGNSWYGYLKGLGMTTTEFKKPDANTTYDPDVLQEGLRVIGKYKTNETYQDVYIFARSDMYGAVRGNSQCRIYTMSTLEDVLYHSTHHFFPVIRKSDNVPGMYDTDDGVFYTNNGTGDFLCGPEKTVTEYLDGNVFNVNVGEGLSVDANNFINVDVMVGATQYVDGSSGAVPQPLTTDVDKFLKGDGTWANPPEYTLPPATASTLGGVIVGQGLSVDQNGVLSSNGISVKSEKEIALSEIEQGTLSYTGENQESSKRVRLRNYQLLIDGITPYSVEINATNSAQMQFSIVTYDSNNTCLNNYYWYNSGATVNVDMTDVVKFRCAFRYESGNTITPADVLNCKIKFINNSFTVGEGLVIDQQGYLDVNIGDGLEINPVTGAIDVVGGGGGGTTYYEGHGIDITQDGPSGLPSGYTELEYIGNTGGSYIATDYTPNTDTSVRVVTNIHSGTASWQCLFGARDGVYPGGNEYAFLTTLNGTEHFYPRITGDTTTYMPDETYNEKITLTITGTSVTVTKADSTSYSYTQSGSLHNLSTTMDIFAMHNGSNNGDPCLAEIYSFKIYENGSVVRNFVPCCRDSDSVVGFYETVNDIFYTNDGSGIFSSGNSVTVPKINTKLGDGLDFNSNDEIEVKIGNGLTVDQNGAIGVIPELATQYTEGDGIEFISHQAPIIQTITHIKWSISETRQRAGGDTTGTMIQASEIEFYDETDQLLTFSAVSGAFSGVSGVSPTYDTTGYIQTPEKLVDEDTSDRCCCTNFGSTVPRIEFIFELDTSISAQDFKNYRYYTADDHSERDPVSWIIYISSNGTDWVKVHEVNNEDIPTAREVSTNFYTVSKPTWSENNINVKLGVGLTFDDNGSVTLDPNTDLTLNCIY